MNLIASVLHLDRKAVRELKIDGPYALHRVVYSLFTDVRSIQEKQGSKPSGFLYADLGGDFESRKILLLSNRSPAQKVEGQYGEVQSKRDRKSTRLNSSHVAISYAVFCLKKKNT